MARDFKQVIKYTSDACKAQSLDQVGAGGRPQPKWEASNAASAVFRAINVYLVANSLKGKRLQKAGRIRLGLRIDKTQKAQKPTENTESFFNFS